MNIRLIRYVACLALVISALAAPSFADAGINVTVDGRVLALDQPPVTTGGRVLVPLRGIFESLGAHVDYDAGSRSVHVERGATNMHLTLNSASAVVNGAPVNLDVPAQTIGGRTMVPLRFVSEALGAKVDWNAASRTVSVASGSAPSVSIEPPVQQTTVVMAPPPPPAPERPVIQSVVTDNSGLMRPGDSLRIVAVGTPGCTATVEIKGMTADLAMTEKSPGRYEANYTIPALSNASAAERPIIVHLTNGEGLEAVSRAPNAIALGGATGNIFVNVLSPRKHERVRSDFVVTGTTLPFANVDVKCSHRISASGQADASGHFSIPVHMGFAPNKRDDIDIEVTATDQNGRISKRQKWEIAVGPP